MEKASIQGIRKVKGSKLIEVIEVIEAQEKFFFSCSQPGVKACNQQSVERKSRLMSTKRVILQLDVRHRQKDELRRKKRITTTSMDTERMQESCEAKYLQIQSVNYFPS